MTLSGNPIDYLVVFAAGLLLSFSPCVYPLLPVTAGYIGSIASGSKLKGFFLSLIYVLGVAVTYSILGLLASLGGQIFGRISAAPITRLLSGVIIVLFGLSMFGFFKINLPVLVKSPVIKKAGFISTFTLGLISGLIVSPCVSPALGAILVYLSGKQNVIYGATLLFVFAYGMGTLLILVGTFSGFIANLPKSGKWMALVTKIFAVVLVFMGLYFIYQAIRRF